MATRKRSEATEQERVVNWARRNEYRAPSLALLHHIPNGGSRNKIEAARLKAQGVKAGVPDLFLPVPMHDTPGLYIEMKFGKNTTSKQQEWWIEQLQKHGYAVHVCWGADEAIAIIAAYMEMSVFETPEEEMKRIEANR